MDGGFSAGKRVGDVDMDSILGSGGMSTESKGERVAREQLERQEKQAALHVEKQARWVEKRRREAVAITLKQGIVGRGLAGKYSANTAEKTKAALSSSSQVWKRGEVFFGRFLSKKNSGAHSRVATLIQPSFQKKKKDNT